MKFSSLRILPTPLADAEYFEGVGSPIKIHLPTDFFLQLFELSMSEFYDPAAPFTDEMVVVLMAQYMLVVMGVSPQVDHF